MTDKNFWKSHFCSMLHLVCSELRASCDTIQQAGIFLLYSYKKWLQKKNRNSPFSSKATTLKNLTSKDSRKCFPKLANFSSFKHYSLTVCFYKRVFVINNCFAFGTTMAVPFLINQYFHKFKAASSPYHHQFRFTPDICPELHVNFQHFYFSPSYYPTWYHSMITSQVLSLKHSFHFTEICIFEVFLLFTPFMCPKRCFIAKSWSNICNKPTTTSWLRY